MANRVLPQCVIALTRCDGHTHPPQLEVLMTKAGQLCPSIVDNATSNDEFMGQPPYLIPLATSYDKDKEFYSNAIVPAIEPALY